jgi:hypothetical protein
VCIICLSLDFLCTSGPFFLVLLFLEKFRFCTVCIIHHSSKYNRQIDVVIEFRKAIFPVTTLNDWNHVDICSIIIYHSGCFELDVDESSLCNHVTNLEYRNVKGSRVESESFGEQCLVLINLTEWSYQSPEAHKLQLLSVLYLNDMETVIIFMVIKEVNLLSVTSTRPLGPWLNVDVKKPIC